MHINHTHDAGLYLHIPFCLHKCPYCDFYSICETDQKDAYGKALQQEMAWRRTKSLFFDSLYIGGGTPSVLDSSTIDKLIQTACQYYSLQPDTEITIEVNPGTVTSEKLRDYRKSGINRLNIGVQSFQDKNLQFLGRIHSAADVVKVLRQARRAGFDNLGLDLMYGLPGQTRKQWRKDMESALAFQPEHLSCYMLSFEKGTPMDRDRQQGIIHPLPDDQVSGLFETTLLYLEQHGMRQYEISNFAVRPSCRSRHNQKYWSHVPYLGFGPSAHSFYPPSVRSWNQRSLQKYMDALQKGRRFVESRETLCHEQQMMEMIYLGLRTTDGLDLEVFRKRFDVDLQCQCEFVLETLYNDGYLKISGQKCFLTIQGQLFLDSIAIKLIEASEGKCQAAETP
jgi:oxygen-independent coproporphyrinogen-3 oxidase